ncbi:bestrophin-2-like [Paramacrobiotus metropolitanus]|uniref:bestrophin-2-like n=1 Tax=Paramacrobiotus metropolitanus TaxID=2943436 RepID=UPI0024465AA5|nr:bestrophin-2-like [Paramacrobiotus metropolitanus]XP_055349584.1 bestrophin-2-like [Paramacrobiotus metropolitanus]
MTISYQLKVANATFAGFPRLLLRWRGSVYKLMYKEFLLYAFCYALMSCVYRLALTDDQRRVFEKLCVHIEESMNHVPLTFVLGFYVTFVVSRWWEQLISYPWPDRMTYLIIFYITGEDERSKMYRRQLTRYLQATTILLTRTLSLVCKKRFPSLEHMVEAGLLTKEELQNMNDIKLQYGKFWVPFVWFTQTLEQARAEGLINDPTGVGVKQIMDELLVFRSLMGKMFAYDWVSIPVSYTQVVTLAVYTYFLGCIFARQFLDPEQKIKGHGFDMYVPVFSILQFIFYVGWLKVAETLINPWGEDDDDFEVNWFIDRHTQVGFCIVDDMHHNGPSLSKDKFWGQTQVQMPYTIAAADDKRSSDLADLGSTMEFTVPLNQQRMSVSGPAGSRRASSVHSIDGIPAASLLPRVSKQWDTPGGLLSRRKSGLSTGHGTVHWALPDRDTMRIIEESPTASEKDSFLPTSSVSSKDHGPVSIATQVPTLVTNNEYFFPRSTGTQAPSIISGSDIDSGSDVVPPMYSTTAIIPPSSPLKVSIVTREKRPGRNWQMRRDSRTMVGEHGDRGVHTEIVRSPDRLHRASPTDRSRHAPVLKMHHL